MYTQSKGKGVGEVASTQHFESKKESREAREKVHQLRSLRIKMENFPTEQLLGNIFPNVDFHIVYSSTKWMTTSTLSIHFTHFHSIHRSLTPPPKLVSEMKTLENT